MSKMDEILIPWNRVAHFARQHSHDVRNGLNSLDLEAELLCDIVTDPEATDSIGRIQKQVRSVVGQLRTLANLFQEPSPIAAPIPASALLRIWHEKRDALPTPPEVTWVDELSGAEVTADVEMMAHLFQVLLENATHFSAGAHLTASALAKEGKVIFELCEPKPEPTDPEEWGRPLVTTRRGGYGLDLWAAKRNMGAIGAAFTQRFDNDRSCVLSRVVFEAL